MPARPSNPAALRRRPAGMHRRLAASAALALPLVAGLMGTAPASAEDGRTLIDFTEDTPGHYPTGFVSVDAPGVTFTEKDGGYVEVQDWGNQSHGQGLGAFLDLAIDFAEPVSALEVSFGNDDPYMGFASDVVMTLFLDGTKVGVNRLATNADDDMNQSIVQTGGPAFDRATLEYVNTDGSSADLAMIVDDVYVGDATPPVDPRACTIVGTPGNDTLIGTSAADVICGRDGNDKIRGLGGNDTIRGGAGDDTLIGGRGDDLVLGGKNRDKLRGGLGEDTAKGGAHLDYASAFEMVRSAKVLN